jgi:uncharacterized protein (DUF169 family)
MTYAEIAASLTNSLSLTIPPVAVIFADAAADGVAFYDGQSPAGCTFWEQGARRAFATIAADHERCAIGQYTHNLDLTPASTTDLRDALRVLGELDYVRDQDLAAIPVLAKKAPVVVYRPLAGADSQPDVVLMFVRPSQQLILAEATQQIEGGFAPAMGRPACAIIPQAVNTQRAALSLGCCGARAYLDELTPEVAIYALPGSKLEDYAMRIDALARANATLAKFHTLRRAQIESGANPSVRDSLAALQTAS